MNDSWCRWLGWAPGPADSQAEFFVRIMALVAGIAGLVHAVFLGLFAYLGVTELALLNVVSLVIYLWAVRHARSHPLWVEVAMFVEIVGHCLYAVQQIGWSSGFHYYVILIIPIAVVSGGLNERDARWASRLGGGSALLLYLWMERTLPAHTPNYALNAAVLDGLRSFNLFGTLGILTFLAWVYRQMIVQSEEALRHQACTDPLTHLSNRRAVTESLRKEVAAAQRQGRSLVVAVGDVDHFKSINDRFGHHGGDVVLQSVAGVLQSAVRQMDHVGRWGGEEFLVVLPDVALPEAVLVAERLRTQVAALTTVPSGAPDGMNTSPIPVTITFGLAAYQAGESVEHLISRADGALYAGKQAGRNRVIAA